MAKSRNVHRDMLKAVIPSDVVDCAIPAPPSPPLPPVIASVDDSSGSETWFLVSKAIALPLPKSSPAMSLEHAGSLPPDSSLSPSDQPSTSQQALCWTAHSIAGCHPNVHHLPWPAGQEVNRSQDPASNS